MFGGSNDDTLSSGLGADQLFGEDGDDRLYGSAGNDRLVAGDGDDTLFGTRGNDTLEGGDGRDRMSGGPQADVLFGGAGDDLLEGGKGRDRLNGGEGDDTLRSGTVSDDTTLNGGPNDDTLVLSRTFGTVETIIYRTGGGFDDVYGLRTEDILAIDVAGIADGDIRSLATQEGTQVVIAFGAGSGLALHDFTLGALDDVTIL